MKTIYTMLAGVFMLASVPAFADVPQCPDHAINAPEMSACHKKRVTAIFGDDYTGRYGSFFVVHVDGEPVATPIRAIQLASDPVEMVEKAILDKISKDLNDEILALEDMYNAALELNNKQGDLIQAYINDISDLQKDRDALLDLQERLGDETPESLAQLITNNEINIGLLEVDLENAHADARKAILRFGDDFTLPDAIVVATMDNYGYEAAATFIATTIKSQLDTLKNSYVKVLQYKVGIANGTQTFTVPASPVISETATDSGEDTVIRGQLGSGHSSYAFNNYTVTIADRTIVIGDRSGELTSKQLRNIVNTVAEAAYIAGYDDGYQAGYAQGFKDGVASVKQ